MPAPASFDVVVLARQMYADQESLAERLHGAERRIAELEKRLAALEGPRAELDPPAPSRRQRSTPS